MTDDNLTNSNATRVGMYKPQCPLCGDSTCLKIDRVDLRSIDEYWSKMGVDVRPMMAAVGGGIHRYDCLDCGLGFFFPFVPAPPEFYSVLRKNMPSPERARWDFIEAAHLMRRFGAQKILEFGCADGPFLRCCGSAFETCTGVDFDDASIQKCEQEGYDVKCGGWDVVDGEFDAVVAFQVIEHLVDPRDFISAALGRLRSGGILIFSCPNEDGILAEIDGDNLNLPPHHMTRWRKSSFQRIAKDYSLDMLHYAQEPLSLQTYQAYLHPVLFRRPRDKGILSRLMNGSEGALLHTISSTLHQIVAGEHSGHSHLACFRKAG